MHIIRTQLYFSFGLHSYISGAMYWWIFICILYVTESMTMIKIVSILNVNLLSVLVKILYFYVINNKMVFQEFWILTGDVSIVFW